MKMVIEIPKEVVTAIQNGEDYRYDIHTTIANGTPLPKEHGRLIDEKELLEMTNSYKSELGRLKADPFVKCGIETVENFIKELPTIIEEDKGEKMNEEDWINMFIDKFNKSKDYKITDVRDREKLLDELRPKGKWEIIGLVDDYAYCKCSECGNTTRLYRDSKNEFCCIADIREKAVACLYCGARME